MKRTKIIGIALVIGSLLLIGINNNSYSDEITSLSATAYTDFGNGGEVWVTVSADTDIYGISVSVKQTYPVDEADDDWIPAYSNMYTQGQRTVYPALGAYDGSLKIAEYAIKAEVWFYDADGNPKDVPDTETSTFSVSKTLETTVPTETQKYPDVSGYARLSGQYYSDGDIVMSCYVSAYNPLETAIYAAQSIFSHALELSHGGGDTKIREEPTDGNGVHVWKEIRSNDPDRDSSYSDSDSGVMTHFGVGPFEKNESASSIVYVKLFVTKVPGVGQDEYVVENSEDFDINDND